MIIVPPMLVVIQKGIALLLVPLTPDCAVSPQGSFYGNPKVRRLEGEKKAGERQDRGGVK